MKFKTIDPLDRMAEQVTQNLEAVLAGRITPEQVRGSTSVRGMLGILLDRVHETNPTMRCESCESYLDSGQRTVIRLIRQRYWWRINDWQREQRCDESL